MNQEKIGKFIAEKRKEKKLTQEQLAEKLNITKNAVSKWERGIGLMDMSLLKPLSEILDITVNDILTGEEIDSIKYKDEAEQNIISLSNYNYKQSKQNIKLKIFSILLLVTLLLIGGYVFCKKYDEYKYTNNSSNRISLYSRTVSNIMIKLADITVGSDSEYDENNVKTINGFGKDLLISENNSDPYINILNKVNHEIFNCFYNELTNFHYDSKDYHYPENYMLNKKISSDEFKKLKKIRKEDTCLINLNAIYEDISHNNDSRYYGLIWELENIHKYLTSDTYKKRLFSFNSIIENDIQKSYYIENLSSYLYDDVMIQYNQIS